MEGEEDGKRRSDRAVDAAAGQAQAQAQQPLVMMETSLVQEESIDESNDASVQEDLQVTLQEKIEMRKNLESTFDCQTLSTLSSFPTSSNINNHMPRSMVASGAGGTGSNSSGLSIQEKIFHFEQKVAANRSAAAPPGRPPLGPLLLEGGVHGGGEVPVVVSKKVPSKRLKVFLRLRPVQDGGPSTIEVLPPSTTTTSTTLNQQQKHHHDSLYPTKIRTHPPKTSNAAKVDRSLARFGGGGGIMGTTADSATSAATDSQVKEYEFTRVFGPEAPQQHVYTHTALPMVNQLCSGNTVGKSALLFCYGITNAGKTHTILGDPKNNNINNNNDSWGIVPRCLEGVLKKVHNTDLQVYVSFLEVYNEHIFDLLPHTAVAVPPQQHRHGLKRVGSSSSLASAVSNTAATVVGVASSAATVNAEIRERRGQIVVQGLANHHVTSLEQGLALIRHAKVGRHTATNNLNQKSSRSHCVCRLTVKKACGGADDNNNNNDDDDACSVGSYRSCGTSHTNYSSNGGAAGAGIIGGDNNEAHFWIVDLAGSERSKRTNMGRVRQQEAACINKSLMTLMRCLTTHSKNKPYRDSKLTVLFMRHWNTVGSQTSMIVNAHASVQDYDETQHVLGYAVSVKVVPTVATTAAGSAAAVAVAPPPRVEYGYDGHRKKVGKQRSTIRKVAKILRKLSPVPKRNNNSNKRKNEVFVINTMGPPVPVQLPLAPQPFGRSLLEPDQHQQPVAKKIRSVADTTHGNVVSAPPPHQHQQQAGQFNAVSSAQYNRELTSLQMALSEARAKIQVLTSKVTGLEQQVEATETQVRAEVAEEMLNEMTAMRQRYEETISRLKELKKNHARPSVVQRNQAMVEELQEKVEELEEDMERMAHHHEEELLSMQHEHAETLLLKDQEIGALKSRLAEMEQQQQQQSLAAAAAAATRTTTNAGDDDVESMQQQLAASRDEIRRLQRSKEELIATYEQLLAGDDEDGDHDQNGDDDDDDDDSENDDDDVGEEEEEEVESDPTPKVERTKHRETLVQKTMTSSTNHAPTRNDDTDASEAGDDQEEEEEETNEPTPKVERSKNIVKKKHQQEEDDDGAYGMSEKDACPTPSLPRRRRKPFGPVSDNKKQAVGCSVKNKVNSSSASSPTTGSSPTNTSRSSANSLDDVSQKATIQEPSSEMVM